MSTSINEHFTNVAVDTHMYPQIRSEAHASQISMCGCRP